MRINLDGVVEDKITSIVSGELVLKTEIYSKEKKEELLNKYGNKEPKEYSDLQMVLMEYNDGIKTLSVNGTTLDEGKNKTQTEEMIIIKNDKNVVSYLRDKTSLSYLQVLNPYINNDDMITGRPLFVRERYTFYLGKEKKAFVESYKELDCEKVIYEKYQGQIVNENGLLDVKSLEIYYSIMEYPIYGIIKTEEMNNSSRSNDGIKIKEMLDLTKEGIFSKMFDSEEKGTYVKK